LPLFLTRDILVHSSVSHWPFGDIIKLAIVGLCDNKLPTLEKMLSVSQGSEQLTKMAGVAKDVSEAHRPKRLYSEVLKQRRRYEPSEASTEREKRGIVGEPTVNWDYKLVRGKWDVPEDAKRFRKHVAIKSWNKRSLKNVLKQEKDETMELDGNLREAVDKLKQLQLTELEGDPLKVMKRTMLTAAEKVPEERKRNTSEDQPKEMVTLQQLWNEFVLATRVKHKRYEKLPKKGCSCGKASIGYPHWPPTSEEESVEQFNYCMNDYNGHRRNLVLRWWEHFNEFAVMTKWNVSERQSYYKEAADLIRLNSLIVRKELERSLSHRKRPKSWSCESYCEKVLTEKQVACLCHCGEHRDECPVHSF
jgi:hypothetical protein